MCGIVTYFGDAGNNLTRVLTGMSAITYRAPDSTGVGLFGDDTESFRARKSLGAVAPLVETLVDNPAYPNTADWVHTILREPDGSTRDAQGRLLRFESLPLGVYEALERGETSYASFEDLVSPDRPLIVEPGRPGRPDPLPEVTIRSRKQFQRAIQELTCTYDLSPVVVRTLIRRTLSDALNLDFEAGTLPAQPLEILNAFDRLFDTASREERSPRPQRIYGGTQPDAPYAERYLWRYLVRYPVRIPADFDRDGVRCLFRLLDSALLTRLSADPGLEDAVQETFERLWPEGGGFRDSGGWRALYWTEKSVNLFGRAASAVLAHLKRREILPALEAPQEAAETVLEPQEAGRTDPATLRSLASPVLSQGRWALQSPVTLKNAHPFFDRLKQRVIVLNGQFSGDVEENLRRFLEEVAGYEFRSRNSSEYFALLWGYYFDVFRGEQARYEAIRAQIDGHLEAFGIGSRSIDYQVYQRLHGKSQAELDALAFVEAARCMARDGGQIAVSGMSLFSPRTLYVASHNRPVFVVRRAGTQDIMVVSDVNAALGLFPQEAIHEKALELYRAQKRHQLETAELRERKPPREAIASAKKRQEQEEARLLSTFAVKVYPLEGEEAFARIQTTPTPSGPARTVTITDFDGAPLPSVEPFQTRLTPLQTGKDIHRSFYESHLLETPERFENTLQFHVSEDGGEPRFDLRESLLRRRFGRNLASLGRIVLLGMGSAHHAGIMSRRVLQRALPGVDVVSLRPVEVEDLKRAIIPEKDLVILLSWSGTTAEMVRAAGELLSVNAACIGVTEKVFSDVGLIASRSVGVIPVLSGEEVTIPGLKSILCMMFSISIFAVWLSSRARPGTDTGDLMEGLQALPELLSGVLQDEELAAFCRDLASAGARSRCAMVIDALYSTGAGREAAFKLEETSWNAVGRSLDYREALEGLPAHDPSRDLVILNATHQARIPEALEVMRKLSGGGTPFAVTGFAGRHQAEMEEAAEGRFAALPKVMDELQPFVDLMFYYRFAFHYGLAHGRTSEDFPRNRAKSVTAGRSPGRNGLTPAGEILEMQTSGTDAATCAEGLPSLREASLWEAIARTAFEKEYYAGMRKLAFSLLGEGGPEAVLRTSRSRPARLSKALFGQVPDEGEMLLVPMDRAAHSTARTLALHWGRLLGCSVRVATPEDVRAHPPQDAVSFFLATRGPAAGTLEGLLASTTAPRFYCGPEPPGEVADALETSLGHCVLPETFLPCAEEALYAGLFLLFIDAWKRVSPSRSATALQGFRQCGPAIQAVLNSTPLRESVTRAMEDNLHYNTAFFIGQPGGTGTAWVRRFDAFSRLAMESYLFGESVHGPLVTVDPRVEEKFVRIEARSRMVSVHGEERVSGWESLCLNGGSVDAFLSDPPRSVPLDPRSPFYAAGSWYLPVLRPGYDPENDNLILMDATSDRFLGQILDEMATYGCRYARVILITQEAFEERPERRTLHRYPIGHVLRLPPLFKAGRKCAVPDLALPLVLNLLSTAMAAESRRGEGRVS
jgi:glucosamine 6-phosphate synthetase-like amidotransferase/phosphosugar isomerase protein